MRRQMISVSLGLGLLASMGAPSLAEEIVVSTHAPPTHINTTLLVTFGERVTKATNGKQTFKVMPGGVLAGATSALAGAKAGAFDGANLVFSLTPSDLPALTFLGELYSADARVAAPATIEAILFNCPQCMEEMKRQNIVVLTGTSSDQYRIFCAGGKRVEKLADLKGKRVRAVGALGPLAATLGATPVNLPITDTYETLNRGQVDCAMLDGSWLESMQLFSVVKHATMAPLGTFHALGYVTASRNSWNRFTDAEKQAWIDSAAVTTAEYTEQVINENIKAFAKSKEKGMELVAPSADLLKAVQDFFDAETPKLAKTAMGRGVKDTDAIVKGYEAANAKWIKIVNGIGEGDWSAEQWKKYTDAIKSEIYARIKPDHFN